MQVELRMKRSVACMVAAVMASPQGWGAPDAANSTITTGDPLGRVPAYLLFSPGQSELHRSASRQQFLE